MPPFHIVMTAAHSGYDSEQVPLGGGAAVCERLCRAWNGLDDLKVTLLGPGDHPPQGVDYLRQPLLEQPPSTLKELAYAKFCRQFERAITAQIKELRPQAVITHDISEGPNFAELAECGIPCVSVFHVDVVDFFNRIYLGDLFPAWAVARMFHHLRGLPIPDVLRLVFDKQEDAVRRSAVLVLPSPGMGTVMEACYPGLERDKLKVIPWGAPREEYTDEELRRTSDTLRSAWGLGPGPILLTLSRISPEKGQDRLLEALAVGLERGEIPDGLNLILCGEPAYMKGERFLAKLRRLAGRLQGARVVFAGHVGGVHKRAVYRMADLFVSPSRHESYGLTTMEALAQGTPVVALRTHGSEVTVEPGWGRLVEVGHQIPLRLWLAIRDLLRRPRELDRMGKAGLAAAREITFPRAADRLLELCRGATTSR